MHEHKHEHEREHEDEPRPIFTRAGDSDGTVGDGEPLTGMAGRDDTEEASDFYEEIGALIEGKVEDVHEPSLEEDEE